ncbi:MFS general substrate transporter [Hyaloscypha hepaticicola]|uniref:MFS general substrate transporter n=1 Tax=Hyaloscypha hepaticicola TaxID=2082293 RepID=A0A2J6Q527_9HELO|nr:MFS general substrate transporter [Hyaloscypha hepaticicola]
MQYDYEDFSIAKISPLNRFTRDIPSISKWRASIIIGTVACINLTNSMLGGILVVSLPNMAHELGLSQDLLLWPAGVNALACGCMLLLSGSIADVVGARKVYLLGAFLLTMTTIACGVCNTGLQLILFRAAQGVAVSLCIPSSVILITSNIPTGTYRNTAFACLGAGQPFGYSIGLVLGGIFVEEVSWRYGYYVGAILTFISFLISIFGIPADTVLVDSQSFGSVLQRMKTEIDLIGCCLLSSSLGLFSYVLSVLASGVSHFLAPTSITLFSIAVLLIPLFIWHTLRQERLARPSIIPPSLWSNPIFTSLCTTVFLIWGIFSAVEFFLTLFYQSVQHLSPLQTSFRFLPMVVTGASANFLTGWLVKRVRADILVLLSAAITALAPLLMALVDPGASYWTYAFFATACTPICADVLFTVANLVITSIFPPKTHGLAGGVFNTISNIGGSVGLAVTAVVASSVSMGEQGKGESGPEMLMDGYRATFWLCFGAEILVLGIVGFGLRKIGKVGIKVD